VLYKEKNFAGVRKRRFINYLKKKIPEARKRIFRDASSPGHIFSIVERNVEFYI